MKVVAQISITVEQKKWLQNKADKENKSMSLLIREMIENSRGDENGQRMD